MKLFSLLASSVNIRVRIDGERVKGGAAPVL